MAVIEVGNDLGIDNDGAVDDEIGDKCAYMVVVVVDGELPLCIAVEALFGKFDDKCSFVEFFIESGLEGEENFVGGTDNGFGKFVGFLRIDFTTDCTEYTEWVRKLYIFKRQAREQKPKNSYLCTLCSPWLKI